MSPFSGEEVARQPLPHDYFPTFVSQNSRNRRGAWRHERRVATGATGELCFTSARELAALMRSGRISAREVMAAHLAQIGRLNPKLNAIVAKLDDEQCLALAEAADRRKARGEALGALHGLHQQCSSHHCDDLHDRCREQVLRRRCRRPERLLNLPQLFTARAISSRLAVGGAAAS